MVRVRVRLVRVRVRVRVVGRVGAAHRRAPVALRAAELRRPRLREDVEVEVAGRVGRRALFAHAARRRTPRAAGRTAGGRHARAPIWDLRAPSGEAFPADENAEQTLRRHQGSIGEFTHNTTTHLVPPSRAAVLHRSLNLVQVDGDRWSPLPRAAKLGELVLAQVALGQRAKQVMASAGCCFPAHIVQAWPCLVERGRFSVPAHMIHILHASQQRTLRGMYCTRPIYVPEAWRARGGAGDRV